MERGVVSLTLASLGPESTVNARVPSTSWQPGEREGTPSNILALALCERLPGTRWPLGHEVSRVCDVRVLIDLIHAVRIIEEEDAPQFVSQRVAVCIVG